MRVLTALTALLPTTFALFADEAYKVDYQHALLGLPQRHTTFFHQPQRDSKASLIYTLSEHGILGAVNPKDGSLVWRQALSQRDDGNTTTGFLVPSNNYGTVVSAVNTSIAAWSALDGKQAWVRDQYLPGNVVDLKALDALGEGESGPSRDLVVVFEGETPVVQRLDGKSGEPKWQYADSSSEAPYGVAMSATKIFYVALSSSIIGSPKLKVTVLDPANGQRLDQISLSADGDLTSVDDIVHLDSSSEAPMIVWADRSKTVLKVNVLGTKNVQSESITNKAKENIEKITVHVPGRLATPTHFLVMYEAEDSHWGEVFHIEGNKSKILKKYDVQRLIGKGTVATSVLDNEIYYTRIAKGAFILLSSKSNEVVDRHLLSDFGVDSVLDYPHPVAAIGEVNHRPGTDRISSRVAILLSSGDWVLSLNGDSVWTRHEELSYITSAAFAELPRKQALVSQLAAESHSTLATAYAHRLKRHIKDLEHLPAYLKALPENFIKSVLGKEDSLGSKSDTFGFHQHVIVTTSHGRLLAIDTSDQGKVVWNTRIPGFKDGVTPTVVSSPQGIIRVKTTTDHAVFDTLSGNFLRSGKESLRSKGNGTLIEYVALEDRAIGVTGNPPKIVWTYHPPQGSVIKHITSRPPVDPIASIGDVLGDRRVLYKYLNPNLALITSTNAATKTLTITLLNTITGVSLYTTTHDAVDTAAPIPAVMSENWFAYSYTLADTPNSSARGTPLVLTKLFESALPDDRGPLGAAKNFSSLHPASSSAASTPHVIAQSYLVPEPISHLATTRTRQSITSRLLLAVLPHSAALAGIPLAALDPRRPVGRDPSKSEAEEGLFRYAATIELDPKWMLSHRREVRGLTHVLASPARLESTSLVFAYGYGGDVFGVRTAPSGNFDVLGKEFNRAQMIATVIALLVGTVVVAPLVRKKTNNMLWEM